MDPSNVERARRNLHRWLDDGILPGRASRAELAHALGIPESALGSDDDDEEDETMHEAFLLFVDLMDQIGAVRQKKNARKRAMRA